MLPQPQPNETQADFAIRFHAEMQADIPRASERNAQMLAQWEQYGSEQERQIGDSIFTPDQYEKRQNVAIFAEHQTPTDRYGRDELKAIADRHNYRIRNKQIFCPLTDGHTGGAGNPATLGFTGAVRLGMIGDEDPQWALFADEYQRKDAQHILRDAPGRSVEIWKHKNMGDRFFYPIAALRADAPRLELPPARYSKAESGERVLVQCYSLPDHLKDTYMMPGGNNTAIPGEIDQYGDDDDSLPSDDAKFNDLMEAFMATEFAQMAMQALEREGKMVATPPISQPPEPAEMPIQDDGDEQPPMPTEGGDMPPDVASMQEPEESPSPEPKPEPQPTPPPQQMPEASGNSPAPQQPPAAEPTPKPAPPQYGAGQGGQPPIVNPVVPEAQPPAAPPQNPQQSQEQPMPTQQEMARKIQELEQVVARLQATSEAQNRYSMLTDLAAEYVLDIDKEIDRTSKYSAEMFGEHIEVIKENYSRRADAAVPDFAAIAGAGRKSHNPVTSESQRLYNEPPVSELDKIEKYCLTHGVSWDEGRERYMSQKQDVAVS
jgi:hypothetical protein